MKRFSLVAATSAVFLTFSGLVCSQTTTPNDPNTISHAHLGGGQNEYEVAPLTPSQNGAYYSYLWWSGDNDFSFVSMPQHTHHDTKGNPNFPQVKMSAITTENYGTGGPPPLTYTFTTNIGNTSPRRVLPTGTDIYMQSYRNAVIGDVMYLIVSYGNSTGRPISGTIRLTVGTHARIATSVLNDHPHFMSNGERWDPNRDECTFRDLNPGEERSILVPVEILRNEEDQLEMRVDFLKGTSQEHTNQLGLDYFMIRPDVAHSHDPNMMIEHSNAQNECDYRNKKIHYTVKFQNEGTGPTSYVRVECQLDDKVNLNAISGITFPDFYSMNQSGSIAGIHDPGAGAIYHIDHTRRVITFEMHDLRLESIKDPNLTNLELARDQVEFDILVKNNYVFGPATVAQSVIYFDKNEPIETNEVQTICGDPLPKDKGGGFQTRTDVKEIHTKEEKMIKR
ncbi:MAG: hypothetical protein P8P74_16200 [Crocinitomicaceae bacterium]|nr:hypothetical protein [Crocinitomicaceae bacterium]